MYLLFNGSPIKSEDPEKMQYCVNEGEKPTFIQKKRRKRQAEKNIQEFQEGKKKYHPTFSVKELSF